MRESGQRRRSLRWLRKLHLHTAHSSERVKQSAWYLADNAENADADIHHRSAEAQAEPQTGPAKTDGRQREMLQAAIRATTTTKASQFFCTKHKKISWQLQGTGLALGSGDWDWDWDWDGDGDCCVPGSAIGINHLTGSVASLVAPTTTSMWPLKDVCCLVALFVHLAFAFAFHGSGRGHCKLKSKSVSPATGNRQPATGNDNKAAPALVSVAHHLVLVRILWLVIISLCAVWDSVCRAAGQSASLLLSSILLYSVPDPVSLPSCVSALVDHRPQCKYVESLVRILCSFLCPALWLCPGKGPRRTLAAAMGAPPETQSAQRTSRSSGNAAEIIISACHICFSTLLLRYFFVL